MKRLFFLMIAAVLCGLGANAKTITGTVIDAVNNEPLIGASVLPVGGGQGVATDIDGKFSITVPDKVRTAKFSYVGYTPQIAELKDGMVVYLSSSTANLDDVVVVAYGAQKKTSITGAISQVDSKQIEARPVSSVAAALEGATSGITITGNYGQPGNDPNIYIRGIGTVNGTSTPLYVVDGVPFGGNISDLNPDDIASMSVLKDAASAALYGSRASNGVILITTKKATNKEKVTFNFKMQQGWYVRGVPEYERTNAAEFMQVEYRNQMNQIINSSYKGNYSAANMNEAHNTINSTILSDRLKTNVWNAPDKSMYANTLGELTSYTMKGTYAEDLDWWEQSTRAGYRANYDFSGQGATDKSDYYFSLGYLDENGFMNKSGFERLSARLAINVKPVSWFRAGLNVNGTHQNQQNSKGNGDDNTSFVNPVYYSRYMSPIYPVHLHDATTGEYATDIDGNLQFDTGYYEDGEQTRIQNSKRHCIYENQLNSYKQVRNTLNGIATADVFLPYGITLSFKGNMNVRTNKSGEYSSAVIGDGADDHGRFKEEGYTYKNWQLQEQIRWNYTFADKHFIEVLAGHENYRYGYDYTYTFKKDEKFAGVAALANFTTVNNCTGYGNNYATESYLARAQYNYDDRYNLEVSWRRDGSSRFDKDVRWGNFGSVGANWIFSSEEFMKDYTWLNSGKLRADWGLVANDNVAGYYAYMSLYDTSSSGTNGGNAAYWYAQTGNPNLKWETGESWGVALETRMFNRWNFSIEYYQRTNRDLIFDLYNPLSAGALYPKYPESTITVNLGKMQNRGIEINTDVDIYKNRDWNVNLAMNLTTVRNRIVELPEQNKDGIISSSQKIMEGHNRYSWWMYHYCGVDQMTGRSLYTPDLKTYHITESDGTIVGGTYEMDEATGKEVLVSTEMSDEAEAVKINGEYYVYNNTFGEKSWRGKALPSAYGAITPSVRYRNFSLSAVFTWSLGGKILDSTYSSLMGVSSSARNYHKDMLNSWYGVPEGMTETSADRISTDINPMVSQQYDTYNNATSDRWLTSRDYLVFKNINASYRLPQNLLRKLQVKDVIVSFSAENLFTKTSRKGLDSQQVMSGYQYNYIPSSRVFTFGLGITL